MIVSLLTDYGHEDEFVGVCHAVIRGIAPDVPIVDLTHGIARYGVREGAIVLRNSLPYVPVGRARRDRRPAGGHRAARRSPFARATGARSSGRTTGCSAWRGSAAAAWSRRSTSAARHTGSSRSSATFHGRDIFAPVAAQLAAGAELAEAGQHVDPDELQVLGAARAEGARGRGRGARPARRPVRQRVARRRHADLAGSGLALGKPVEIEVAAASGSSRRSSQTFADVRPGRRDPLRGLLPHARDRGEPRRRRRGAQAHAGRDGRAAAAMIGLPRVHHRVTDSTNERAKQLGGRRRAARDARHRRRAERGARPAGADVERGARRGAARCPSCSARLDELLPFRAAVAVAESIPLARSDQVAERRLDRGPKGLGNPRRGAAAGGLGRARDRAERVDALVSRRAVRDRDLPGAGRRLAVARGGARRAAGFASSAGSPPTPPTSSRHGASATLFSARPVAWDGGRGRGAGITDAGALRVETDAGIVELDAGEVHLQR